MTGSKTPRIIAQLLAEHEVVDRVTGSLFRWAVEGQADAPEARAVYAAFFRDWVSGFHHRHEEEVLFAALVSRADIPPDRGPLKVLGDEHHDVPQLIDAFELADPGAPTLAAVRALAHLLWAHLDKENSVFLPEAGERLVRNGVAGLEGVTEDDRLGAVRGDAERLVERWPPLEDDEMFRGDGCMVCSAYGDRCGGIEKEWWNEWEWEHHRSFKG